MNTWGLRLSLPLDLVHQDTLVRIALANITRVGAISCVEYSQHNGHLGICTVGGSLTHLKTGWCFENWLHLS